MKNLLLTILAIFITAQIFAQSPHGFKYQAVVRDPAGAVLSEKAVSFRISIIQASTLGTVVYKESFITTTNLFGLVTLEIGSGSPITGLFENIEWSKDIYYLKIELDASGGTNYVLMGVSQLLSVPYALYAEKSTFSVTDHDTSAVNEIQTLNINNYKLTISKGNTINIPEGDSNATNELQKISFYNDTLLLDRNGGYVYLGNYDNSKAINNLLLKMISDSNYSMNYTNNRFSTLSDSIFYAVNTENVKRFVEDSLLRLKIKNDSISLKGKINDNLLYIQAEQTFRINGDNALYMKIDSDSNYLKSRIDNTNALLTTETNNRNIYDNRLSNRIIADSNNLVTRINTVTNNLNTEISNRQSNESLIINKIQSDSSYLRGLISNNTNALNTQTNYRRYYDSILSSRISADSLNKQNSLSSETNQRIYNDSINHVKTVSDSSYLRGLINTNAANTALNANSIASESASRLNRDNFLLNRINSDSSFLKGQITSDSSYLNGLINTNTNDISSLSINLQNNYYTKTNLQSSSGAMVHFDNLTNRPVTLSGYGITDAAPLSHIGATGSFAHGLVNDTASGFMSAPDKMKLDSVSGYNTGDQTINPSGSTTPKILLSANGGQVVFKGAGHTTLDLISDTISISSTDTFTTYYAGTGIMLSGTTFNTVWSVIGNDIYNNNSGNIGIGTSTPNAAALLEINSTTQGFLPPRMSNSDMLIITNPPTGLTVYNNDENCPCWYNGSMWVCNRLDYKSCGKIEYDSQIYNTVIIANKCWMKENLNIGSMIQASVLSSNNGIIEKYCYNNVYDSCKIYGGLYSWNEAMEWGLSSNGMPSGVQGICPPGWHMPSSREWDTMEYQLYGIGFAGGYLKERSTKHWLTPNTGADNYTGFTALGSGNKTALGGFSNGKTIAYYWTSTEATLNTNAIYHSVRYNGVNATASNWDKLNGISVRCVKN